MTAQLMSFKEGESIDTFALIKKADVRQTKNGQDYLALVFTDRSGELPGNLWSVSPEQVEALQAGKVVKLVGVRDAYQGKPQVKINDVRLTEGAEPTDSGDFIKRAPLKRTTLDEQISDLLFEITQPTWNRLVRYLMDKFHDQFLEYPAAKTNHHAFAGGLAYHSLSIANLAKSVSDLYPQVNRELLIAGALLHDLGKVIELSGPVATEYTTAGKLIGHITLVDEQIVLAAHELGFDLNREDMLMLRHVVLAHHGLLEYGSPVRPQLFEAELLHQFDEMDASIQMLSGAMEQTGQGEWSKRIFAMDNRSFYRPENAMNTSQGSDDVEVIDPFQ